MGLSNKRLISSTEEAQSGEVDLGRIRHGGNRDGQGCLELKGAMVSSIEL